MKTFAVVTLGLLTCAGLSARADDKKADAPKLAGTYTLVAGKKGGEAVGDEAKKGKYTIDAKAITIWGGDKKAFVMGYKLDPSTKPVSIDMEILESEIFPNSKGSKGYGIVEMKGDTLKLAYTDKDKESRPKDFSGKEGFLFELKRQKKGK
jgi:uncharacterized protein (TIGR03067 family)